jgi:hypothetical protein
MKVSASRAKALFPPFSLRSRNGSGDGGILPPNPWEYLEKSN